MTSLHPLLRLVPICLLVVTAIGIIPHTAAAQPQFGSLMLHARDLGSGFYDYSSGYGPRCTILQPGIPFPATTKLIQQHGFVRGYNDMIWTNRRVNNQMVLSITEHGCQFASAAGAHWAFVHAKTASPPDRPQYPQVALGRAGEESFGLIPEGVGPGRLGIIFRQGRYLAELDLQHQPAQPQRLVTLARLVATRLQQQG